MEMGRAFAVLGHETCFGSQAGDSGSPKPKGGEPWLVEGSGNLSELALFDLEKHGRMIFGAL